MRGFFLLLVCVIYTNCHPQCLDYRPPFEAKHKLSFCSQYENFGCCSQERDLEISQEYSNILPQVQNDGLESCKDIFKEIMCQECSPYAAHIYDAEATQIKRPFPGLCKKYCFDFYSRCSGLIKYLTNDSKLVSISSGESFCKAVALVDVDYCYPDLLSNSVLNGNISREAITKDGCMCLEQLATGLRNPLLLESPPDNTGRLFVAEQIGVIHVYFKDGRKLDTPFIDITSKVHTSSSRGDERGFLGLAFHPKFAENRKVYMYYSIKHKGQQKIRISEILTQETNENVADETSERVLLEISQPYWNHNGGEV